MLLAGLNIGRCQGKGEGGGGGGSVVRGGGGVGARVLIILGIPVVHIILGVLGFLGILDILVILELLENCSQSPFLLSQATHVAERFHLVNLLTR